MSAEGWWHETYAPGECDGSRTCTAPDHVEGCFATEAALQRPTPESTLDYDAQQHVRTAELFGCPPPESSRAFPPPLYVFLEFCPVCGRDERNQPFTGRSHFRGGVKCLGTPERITYELPLSAAVPESNE